MISLDMGVQGGKKNSVKLTRFKREMIPNLIKGVDKGTLRLEREIKLNLSKGGEFRRAKGRPWVPNPSIGELTLRSGNSALKASWKSRKAKRTRNNVEGRVATDVKYAAIHEFGGTAGRGGRTRLPARPYVRPAIKAKEDQVIIDITSEVVKPLRRPVR